MGNLPPGRVTPARPFLHGLVGGTPGGLVLRDGFPSVGEDGAARTSVRRGIIRPSLPVRSRGRSDVFRGRGRGGPSSIVPGVSATASLPKRDTGRHKQRWSPRRLGSGRSAASVTRTVRGAAPGSATRSGALEVGGEGPSKLVSGLASHPLTGSKRLEASVPDVIFRGPVPYASSPGELGAPSPGFPGEG
ncbi:hypothetical protein G5I_09570 [Acromyrmex echinatior]|uniref:Uncharacterized protein n=1 Tax=Acromyrmex echinatior TaxID=103372 RepID=F4WUJ9_ACREC|nr:hypothetical protein G5I_09570 [Acromyrmex echinatior]